MILTYEHVYLVSDNLAVATGADVTAAEQALSVTFPPGYSDFVTELGDGIYGSHVHIYLPNDIVAQIEDFRQDWAEFAFFGKGQDALPESMIKDSIPLGDTIDGDYIVCHPARPNALYVLPRHDERIYEAGATVPEALDWLLRSGVLLQPGAYHVLTPSGQFVERDFRFFESTIDRAAITYGCRKGALPYPTMKAFLLRMAQSKADEATLVTNVVDGEDNFTALFLKSFWGVVSCNAIEGWGSEAHISYDVTHRSDSLEQILAYFDQRASFRRESTETGDEAIVWDKDT